MLVFNFIYCINVIYIITTSFISNIINHFYRVMLTFFIHLCYKYFVSNLLFYCVCVIFILIKKNYMLHFGYSKTDSN